MTSHRVLVTDATSDNKRRPAAVPRWRDTQNEHLFIYFKPLRFRNRFAFYAKTIRYEVLQLIQIKSANLRATSQYQMGREERAQPNIYQPVRLYPGGKIHMLMLRCRPRRSFTSRTAFAFLCRILWVSDTGE